MCYLFIGNLSRMTLRPSGMTTLSAMTTMTDGNLPAGGLNLTRQLPDQSGQQGGITNQVPTLVGTDATYLQHTAVCLVSLLVNNPELFFDIVVVRRPAKEFDEDKLHRSLAPFQNYRLTFKELSIRPDVSLPSAAHYQVTADTYSRFWVEEFFAEDVDRVLCLDVDMVIVGSIAPLWNTDLEGRLVGVVDIPGAGIASTRIGLRAEDGYFNSGVLLIDLKQWRETQMRDVLLDYMRTHPEYMVYTPDQDTLNACLYNRKKSLDPRWNAIWTFFQEQQPVPLSTTELQSIRREARIIHYNIRPKPWSYFSIHPRKDEYEKYLKMTEWRNFVPPDRTLINRVRKLAARLLPTSARRGIRRLERRLRG
jgi:lipopolysaccharide biosynthesis glycosyltransferase